MNVVAYARYSSDNQRDESITAQLRAIENYCLQNNYTIVKTYVDEALSGMVDKRPQFLQMIKDSSDNIFSCVIVHKLDRFARNRYDSAFYKKKLKDNHVKLLSVLENFDNSPESIILESVIEGMNEYYSANLSREVKKGKKETALQLKHNGGKPPFGYDVTDEKKYKINDHEAKAVLYIFTSIANGMKTSDVVKWLNNNGYKSKYNKNFSTTTINSIIKNEKYRGVYEHGKTKRVRVEGIARNIENSDYIRVEDGMPRIVSDEIWNKASEVYSKRVNKEGGRCRAKEIYLLSGLIECGICGGSMCGNKNHPKGNRNPRVTYRCTRRKTDATACNMKDIRKDFIEDLVLEEISRILNPVNIDTLIDKVYSELQKNVKRIPRELKYANIELDKVTYQINKIINAVMEGLYSPSMKEKMSDLENRKEILVDKIEYLEKQNILSMIPNKDYIGLKLLEDADIINKSPDKQQDVIRTYIKKVIVHPNEIKIISEVDTINGADGN